MQTKIELEKEKVVSLYNSGMSQREVAKALGVKESAIFLFMKRNNIKARGSDVHQKIKRKTKNTKPETSKMISLRLAVENIGYKPKKIEKTIVQKEDDAYNLYIPEKWNWRGYE